MFFFSTLLSTDQKSVIISFGFSYRVVNGLRKYSAPLFRTATERNSNLRPYLMPTLRSLQVDILIVSMLYSTHG